MEDDARPIKNQREHVCSAGKLNNLILRAPSDALALLLGAHHISYDLDSLDELKDSADNIEEINAYKTWWVPERKQVNHPNYIRSITSLGAYAFAVPRDKLRQLAAYYVHDISSGEFENAHGNEQELIVKLYGHANTIPDPHRKDESAIDFISPDVTWYAHALSSMQHIYVVDPLIVFHHSGVSNTWHRVRSEAINGHNDYLTYWSRKENSLEACRFSMPVYNVSRAYWWRETSYFELLEEAQIACSELRDCLAVVQYGSHPALRDRYFLATEPAQVSATQLQNTIRSRVLSNNISVHTLNSMPVTYSKDPTSICWPQIEKNEQWVIKAPRGGFSGSMKTTSDLHVVSLRKRGDRTDCERKLSFHGVETCLDVQDHANTSVAEIGTAQTQKCQLPPRIILNRMVDLWLTEKQDIEKRRNFVQQLLFYRTASTDALINRYKAHLMALKELCLFGYTYSEYRGFGIVLEPNIDSFDNNVSKLVHPFLLSSPIVELMKAYPDVTVFNLAPLMAFRPGEHRFASWMNKLCTANLDISSIQTGAIGYNLSSACSPEFFKEQQQLIDCVPFEMGIFTSRKYESTTLIDSVFKFKDQPTPHNSSWQSLISASVICQNPKPVGGIYSSTESVLSTMLILALVLLTCFVCKFFVLWYMAKSGSTVKSNKSNYSESDQNIPCMSRSDV